MKARVQEQAQTRPLPRVHTRAAVAAALMTIRLAKTFFFVCLRVELLPQHCYVHELALFKSDWKCSRFMSPHYVLSLTPAVPPYECSHLYRKKGRGKKRDQWRRRSPPVETPRKDTNIDMVLHYSRHGSVAEALREAQRSKVLLCILAEIYKCRVHRIQYSKQE